MTDDANGTLTREQRVVAFLVGATTLAGFASGIVGLGAYSWYVVDALASGELYEFARYPIAISALLYVLSNLYLLPAIARLLGVVVGRVLRFPFHRLPGHPAWSSSGASRMFRVAFAGQWEK